MDGPWEGAEGVWLLESLPPEEVWAPLPPLLLPLPRLPRPPLPEGVVLLLPPLPPPPPPADPLLPPEPELDRPGGRWEGPEER